MERTMDQEASRPSTRAKVGWWILLVISGLMLLNGVTWFFVGPGVSVGYAAEVAGMPVEEFTGLYPGVAAHQARTARQVAVWYGAFGAMALLVAREGLRHGTRWVWYATWVVVAAPVAIGLIYLPGVQLSFDNIGLLAFGAAALVGQLLARGR